MQNFMKKNWDLETIQFVSSPPQKSIIEKVFTGREKEIDTMISSIIDSPHRVIINGLFGVGKTVFIKESQRRLQLRKKNKIIFIEESLSDIDSELSSVILRGLVKALKDEDQFANDIYNQLCGKLYSRKEKRKYNNELKVGFFRILGGKTSQNRAYEIETSLNSTIDPSIVIKELIEKAVNFTKDRRIIIAIDDIDKNHDPKTIKDLFIRSRDLLHIPECSFIFTGHPIGVMKDIYSSAGGIIDREIDINPMDERTLQLLIVRYLSAGRPKHILKRRYPQKIDNLNEKDFIPFEKDSIDEIIKKSYGIPRVLNIICYNILHEAAIREYKKISINELRICWNACKDKIQRGIRPDFRSLIEYMSTTIESFNLDTISDLSLDGLMDTMQIDTKDQLLGILNNAVKNDLLITTKNNRELVLHSIIKDFD